MIKSRSVDKLQHIKGLITKKNYSISKHAFAEAFQDNFSLEDILNGIQDGEVIENYLERKRLLIYAKLRSKAIHIVVDYSEVNYIWIVTVYKPDPNEWISDKVRKERLK